MRPLLIALALSLAACVPATRPSLPQPVPALCSAACYQPCDTQAPTWAPADPDSPDAWDTLAEQVLAPVIGQLEQCEVRRAACAACIQRHKAAGVLL